MANPFAQKVRQRKIIYFALVLVFFSVGLIHRNWWIEKEAVRLKLREVAKGEVELTSSAVRLSLTGSRGLAVTFLWSAAIRQQERHEWNELELLIGAVTKLQPYFITPWLFQGWNLAYNVAVECDRPHDKFYYVNRGLRLLAEGERRNQEQSVDPKEPGIGQPDLRHFIGVAYQGKFGISDEKMTMRSLLDLSCIDPVHRDPARFWTVVNGRKAVNLPLFAKFCTENPRLVRRLRDHLNYADPRQILDFLEKNQEVPMRFEKPVGGAEQKETPLKKDERDQFPVLPPYQGVGTPDPNDREYGLSQESMDVFIASRAWFDYAQKPVPPPSPDPEKEINFDRSKYRLPKAPAMPIYRGFPARAQMYSAEELEAEGWFDSDGWLIKDWFERDRSGADEFRIGTQVKYHAAPAWNRAFIRYMDLGLKTGQYLSPGDRAELQRKAEFFRKEYNVDPSEFRSMTLQPKHRNDEKMVESLRAHMQLGYNAHTARMTNFDGLFAQAEAERTVELVTARKLLHRAERLRRFENPEQALALFDEAWPLWIGAGVRFPKFQEQSTIQEDAYELQLKHLRTMQIQYPVLYRSLATGFAQFSVWPHVPWDEVDTADANDKNRAPRTKGLLEASDRSKVYKFRDFRGILDWSRVYDVRQRDDLSRALLAWTQAAGTPRLFMYPGQEAWMLVAFESRNRPLESNWKQLFEDYTIQMVKTRLGLSAPAPALPSEAVAPPPVMKK